MLLNKTTPNTLLHKKLAAIKMSTEILTSKHTRQDAGDIFNTFLESEHVQNSVMTLWGCGLMSLLNHDWTNQLQSYTSKGKAYHLIFV